MRAALCVAFALSMLSSPAVAADTQEIPTLPKWAQMCGPDFVSFVGRRWLLTSNAVDKSEMLDAVNIWTVQKRSILSVRAFDYGETICAFVAVDLGQHRLSKDGRPVDIVTSIGNYRLLLECFAGKAAG